MTGHEEFVKPMDKCQYGFNAQLGFEAVEDL